MSPKPRANARPVKGGWTHSAAAAMLQGTGLEFGSPAARSWSRTSTTSPGSFNKILKPTHPVGVPVLRGYSYKTARALSRRAFPRRSAFRRRTCWEVFWNRLFPGAGALHGPVHMPVACASQHTVYVCGSTGPAFALLFAPAILGSKFQFQFMFADRSFQRARGLARL